MMLTRHYLLLAGVFFAIILCCSTTAKGGALVVGQTLHVAEGTLASFQGDNDYRWATIDAGMLGTGITVTSSAVNLTVTAEDAASYQTVGFCIDPFHWSSGSIIAYKVAPLAGGSKWPGDISDVEADQIARLWRRYYRPIHSGMTNAERSAQLDTNAGLQIIIWNLASQASDSGAEGYFRAYNYSDDVYRINEMNDWYAIEGANAPKAQLLALQCLSEAGQDYVVEVPDTGVTVLFLLSTFGLLGCMMLRQRTALRRGLR